jgi:hypothetical protein
MAKSMVVLLAFNPSYMGSVGRSETIPGEKAQKKK